MPTFTAIRVLLIYNEEFSTEKTICSPCPTVSDHEAPHIISNIPVNKFETRYKYIRNLKNFELEKCVQDFKELPIPWYTPLMTQRIN